jgi:hypothetical protein
LAGVPPIEELFSAREIESQERHVWQTPLSSFTHILRGK